MDLGMAIKAVRKKLGISQQELAERCEISQTSLSQIENGVKRPSQRTVNKVCVVLDIPEAILYIVAMQEADVPPAKIGMYNLLYPSMKSLALRIANPEGQDVEA